MKHSDGSQSFWIPFTLPSMNKVIGANRNSKYNGAKLKKNVQRDIDLVIRKSDLKPVKGPVEIEIHWFEENARRDVDNIQSGKKFILDSLVEMKILPDDNQRWVKQIWDTVIVARGNQDAGVLVILYEIKGSSRK